MQLHQNRAATANPLDIGIDQHFGINGAQAGDQLNRAELFQSDLSAATRYQGIMDIACEVAHPLSRVVVKRDFNAGWPAREAQNDTRNP